MPRLEPVTLQQIYAAVCSDPKIFETLLLQFIRGTKHPPVCFSEPLSECVVTDVPRTAASFSEVLSE